MRIELEHFRVGADYGGDQEKFADPGMKIGGCGAVTACDLCIYLAKYRGMNALYPFDPQHVTQQDYLDFGMQMRAFLAPRAMGIHKTEIFVEGLSAYLNSRGTQPLPMQNIRGSLNYGAARDLICDQIDRGFPVPYLMLLHRDNRFKDFMWHWFLLNGYERFGDTCAVKAVSYGEWKWMDLQQLWQTGRSQKGGFVRLLLHEDQKS